MPSGYQLTTIVIIYSLSFTNLLLYHSSRKKYQPFTNHSPVPQWTAARCSPPRRPRATTGNASRWSSRTVPRQARAAPRATSRRGLDRGPGKATEDIPKCWEKVGKPWENYRENHGIFVQVVLTWFFLSTIGSCWIDQKICVMIWYLDADSDGYIYTHIYTILWPFLWCLPQFLWLLQYMKHGGHWIRWSNMMRLRRVVVDPIQAYAAAQLRNLRLFHRTNFQKRVNVLVSVCNVSFPS